MKKCILAAAVSAAFISAPVMAETTLYGHAHVSVDFQDSDAGSGFDVLSNVSRIGVKGAHKLTDSLKAVYQMEWGVALDGEGDDMIGANQRNRIVGLAGGFGTVVFGRHDTPLKVMANGVTEDWGSTQMGGSRQIRSKGCTLGCDRRLDNVIGWISPSFGPVSIFAAYVPDLLASSPDNKVNDEFTDADEGTAYSAVLNIGDKKKWYAGIGFEHAEVGDLSEDLMRVGVVGNMGGFRLNAMYQQAIDAGLTAGHDQSVYGVGASMKFGGGKLKGQYYIANEFDDAADTGGSLAMIGYDHALSKSTTLYAQYAMVENDANTNAYDLIGDAHGTGGDGATVANGGDVTGISLGMRVKF